MGRVVGLSPLVVVLAITLWGFVLGPIGALLAVPLTMVAKLMLAENPRYGWLARLLSYRPIPRIALLRRYGLDREAKADSAAPPLAPEAADQAAA